MKTKFLFIDDSARFLAALQRFYQKNSNVGIAECHDVGEALKAVDEYEPETLFLDHNLTEGGAEGFLVLDELQRKGSTVKVYSSTDDAGNAAAEYRRRGIEVLGKTSFAPYCKIIDAQ